MSTSRNSRLLPAKAFALTFVIILLITLVCNNSSNNLYLLSIFTTTTTNKPFSYYFTTTSSSYNGERGQPHPWRSAGWRNAYFINKIIGFEEGIIHKNHNPPSPPSSSSSNNIHRALSPDVTKCGPAKLPPHAITSPNCCPTLPSSPFEVIDFTTPNTTTTTTTTPLRVRKPAHLVDEEFIAKFEKGIALMKALPEDDPRNFIQQAKVHCAYCNGGYPQHHPFQHLTIDVHRSWLFFPFHRLYIYFFERILAHLIGDPTFALPYWNWDSVEGMQIPSFFTEPNSSLNHKLRHYNHMPPHLVDLNYHVNAEPIPQDQQVSFNLAFMYKQMVLANTKELFMGSPYRLGDKAQPGIGSVELAPHNTVHKWTGAADTPNHEDMGTFYTAARDPIFYSHHSNLDRLWEVWKTLDGGRRRGYDDDPDWLDSEFFFYDENVNLVRVKIRDCLDTKKLGYVYEEVDLQWRSATPKPRRTRKQRELAAKNKKKADSVLGSSSSSKPAVITTTKFPLVLDSNKVSAIVKRPNKKLRRSKAEKEQEEEEVLVIEIVDLQSDKDVKFDVHIDDDDEEDNMMMSGPDQTEFVGTFVNVPHGHGHGRRGIINTRYMVGISKVLEDLEAEQDDYVVVTLVPIVAKAEVTIASIHIHFIPKS